VTEEQRQDGALSRDQLLAKLKDLQKPISIEELADILDTTIKHDTENKVTTFIVDLNTYTEEDQLNLSFTAESSTGKSYIPLEIAWYFPREDVIEYSYVSPTAFYHDYGVLIPDPADTRTDVEEEKKHKIRKIDLHQKLLIFLDQPHDILLQRLRPLLSHDRKILTSKITNRSDKTGLRTEVVVIVGYPTVNFCTAKFSMEDQERTRLLILSPDISQDKIHDSILLKLQKESDRDAFNKLMEEDPKRRWLAQRVSAIRSAHIKNIIIPEEMRNVIADRFFDTHKTLIPRNMRDFGRLMGLIKGYALLNLWQHQQVEKNIIVNEEDVEEGFRLYEHISVANELGLPPGVYDVYDQLRRYIPLDVGVTNAELSALYYKVFHRPIGSKRLEEIVKLLLSVGLWIEDKDPDDQRKKRYKLNLPTGQGVYSFEPENNGAQDQLNVEKLNTLRPVGTESPTTTLEANHTTQFPSLNVNDVLKLEHLTGNFQDKCAGCGFQGQMGWQVTYHDQTWGLLCDSCGINLEKKMQEP
jgi:hypothetical protein